MILYYTPHSATGLSQCEREKWSIGFPAVVEKAFILSLVAGLRLSTSPEDRSWVGLALPFLKVRIMHTAFFFCLLFFLRWLLLLLVILNRRMGLLD